MQTENKHITKTQHIRKNSAVWNIGWGQYTYKYMHAGAHKHELFRKHRYNQTNSVSRTRQNEMIVKTSLSEGNLVLLVSVTYGE